METSTSSSPTTSPLDARHSPFCGNAKLRMRFYCHPLNFEPLPNIVYRNNGNGVFSDVSAPSGIGAHRGNGLGVVIADLDDDRWPEVFVANDSMPNFLFHGTGRPRTLRRDRTASRRGGGDRRTRARRHGHRRRRLRRRRAARPRRDQSRFRDAQPLSRAWASGCSRTRRPRAASARRRCPSSDSASCSSTSTTTRSSIWPSPTATSWTTRRCFAPGRPTRSAICCSATRRLPAVRRGRPHRRTGLRAGESEPRARRPATSTTTAISICSSPTTVRPRTCSATTRRQQQRAARANDRHTKQPRRHRCAESA